MAGWTAWVGLVTGILTVLGVVVAVTTYVTSLQTKIEREKLASENKNLADRVAALRGQIAGVAEVGAAAINLKVDADHQLRELMRKTGASGGSIYMPVRTEQGEIQGLAFVSAEPYRAGTLRLQSMIIPLRSVAGSCFEQGQPFITKPNQDHYKTAAKAANYMPVSMMNLPIEGSGEKIGVLQLLRTKGEPDFEEQDIASVRAMLQDITALVARMARTPDFLKALGVARETAPVLGTALLFDLSRSSILFEELSPGAALQRLNEYLDAMCEVALKAGGSIENYMGDGALIGFNIPKPLAQHELAAASAALEMARVFSELKARWTSSNPRFAQLHHRCGISTGALVRAVIGHPLSQRLSLIGPPIAVAAALCNAAGRDAEMVWISADTYEALEGRVGVERLPSERLGKALAATDAAFVLQDLRR
jgi:class 3 adenylate cyclase